MEYDPHLADCRDCEWSQPMPNRDTADHAKRVHEDSYPGHAVVVELLDEEALDDDGEFDREDESDEA